jgi:hypothetical protein
VTYGHQYPHTAYDQQAQTSASSGQDPPAQPVGDPIREMADRARAVKMRQQAVARLKFMTLRHAQYAWERRYSDPIAPYGLAILYVQNDPIGQPQVTAATKLWLAGPEAADLPRLLFDLIQVVGKDASRRGYDVSRDLANRVDDKRTEDAQYIGLGVSSLDTHTGTWSDARDSADYDTDIPATMRIVLLDKTIIVCDRRGLKEFNTLTVHSTAALSISGPLDSPYAYSFATPEDLGKDPLHGQVLRFMEELSHLIWRTEAARLSHGGQR